MKTSRRKRFWISFLVFACIMIGLLHWGLNNQEFGFTSEPVAVVDQSDELATGSEKNIDNSDADFEESTEEPEQVKKQANVPMKWIPAQKVLSGAPPTYISLEGAIDRFDRKHAFGLKEGKIDRTKLEISVLGPRQSKVVRPEIEGTELILRWSKANAGKDEVVLSLKYENNPPVFLSLSAEVWKPNYFWMLSIVIGGLGLFLFGMRNMSEGLQMIAGASLRRMIAFFTDNRFLAVGIGVLTTMLIQSSSVTTVMVVGFINSQIMTLSQCIGVIMGANVGTTITGWILTLKIDDYGLLILGISSFFYLFASKERIRYIAMCTMGLGFLFFGLKTMGSGFTMLNELPQFSAWIRSFNADTFSGVIMSVAVGCVITMIIQSSAATLGITISLASIGAIEFSTAAALVLGENVGTTITAFLASIGTSVNARRAAYFHIIFNILGVCWVVCVFKPFLLPFVVKLVNVHDGQNIAAGIAMTHSLFNITNTLLFLPFVNIFANLLTKYVKDKKTDHPKHVLTSLAIRHMETPLIAVERSRVEISRMMVGCCELGNWLTELEKSDYNDDKLIADSFKQEENFDHMQDEVIDFLAELLSKNLSVDTADSAREQLRLADELETITDYIISILKSNLKLKESGLSLPAQERVDCLKLHLSLMEVWEMVRAAFVSRSGVIDLLQDIYTRRKGFTYQVKQIRDRFLKSMSEERYDPQIIVALNSQLNCYRRLREHIQNVVEAMAHIK